jgi:hypothetical protein
MAEEGRLVLTYEIDEHKSGEFQQQLPSVNLIHTASLLLAPVLVSLVPLFVGLVPFSVSLAPFVLVHLRSDWAASSHRVPGPNRSNLFL